MFPHRPCTGARKHREFLETSEVEGVHKVDAAIPEVEAIQLETRKVETPGLQKKSWSLVEYATYYFYRGDWPFLTIMLQKESHDGETKILEVG